MLFAMLLDLFSNLFSLPCWTFSSKTFMGSLTLVGTVSEFPVFHFSKHLIKRYGHARMLQVSHMACTVRLLCLALLVTKSNYNPLMYYIQLSHGLCLNLPCIEGGSLGAFTHGRGRCFRDVSSN